MARRESHMALSDNDRTLEILLAILERRINEMSTSSVLGCVSGDCVIILLLSVITELLQKGR